MASSKPTVYVETTVISYLASRPSRDLVVAAHQEVTRQWWQDAADRFELLISPMVEQEITRGDHDAAQRRAQVVAAVPVLPVAAAVSEQAEQLATHLGLPEKALADVFHIAYCVVYEVDFLVTWNCTHIANSHVLRRLRNLANEQRFFLPTIVTPDALVED